MSQIDTFYSNQNAQALQEFDALVDVDGNSLLAADPAAAVGGDAAAGWDVAGSGAQPPAALTTSASKAKPGRLVLWWLKIMLGTLARYARRPSDFGSTV